MNKKCSNIGDTNIGSSLTLVAINNYIAQNYNVAFLRINKKSVKHAIELYNGGEVQPHVLNKYNVPGKKWKLRMRKWVSLFQHVLTFGFRTKGSYTVISVENIS